VEGGSFLQLAGSTPPGFETLSAASDPVLVPSAPSAPPALMPGGNGGTSSAFNNDPTVDRAMFDRLRAGRSLEEVQFNHWLCFYISRRKVKVLLCQRAVACALLHHRACSLNP